MLYFRPSTSGFYNSLVHGEEIPEDAVRITEEEYKALIDGQADPDKTVALGPGGKPILKDREYSGQELKDRLTYLARNFMAKKAQAAGFPNIAYATPDFQQWSADVHAVLENILTMTDNELNGFRKNPENLFKLLPTKA